MDNEIMISCLLTVYNRPTVKNTIDSVLNQTYKNFELIIIDNCSTDKTVEVIKSYSDPRIKLYINDSNYGQVFSLNKGLKLCRGKYIARIDADDLCSPDRFEKQITQFEENENLVIVGSNVNLINTTDNVIGEIKYPESDTEIKKFILLDSPFAHPSVMIKKEVIDKHNVFYNDKYLISADYELWSKILKYGAAINIQEPLVFYRIGTNDSAKHIKLLSQEVNSIKLEMLKDISNKKDHKHFHKICNYECNNPRSLIWIIPCYINYLKLFKFNNKFKKIIKKNLYYRYFTQNTDNKVAKLIIKLRGGI